MSDGKTQEELGEEDIQFIEEIFAGTNVYVSPTYVKWTEHYEYCEMKILPPGFGYIVREYEIPDRAMPHPRTMECRSKEHALYWFINNRLPAGVYKKHEKKIESYLEKLNIILKEQDIDAFDYVVK